MLFDVLLLTCLEARGFLSLNACFGDCFCRFLGFLTLDSSGGLVTIR